MSVIMKKNLYKRWQLVGEDDSSDELHLVGAMVDEANVSKKGKDLHIQLLRKA